MIAALALTVVVDGFPLQFDQPPLVRGGRVYVPLRGIFERLGASVVYAGGTIDATRGTHTIQLRIGSTSATVDGGNETLDAPPFVAGNRTLVPLRFVAQALGATVGYDHAMRTVAITSPAPPRPPPTAAPPPAPTPRVTPTPKPTLPAHAAANYIVEIRPTYDQFVGGAFTVSGRTHAGATVRIDAVSSGRVPPQPWTRQGATTVTVTADDRGYFSTALALPAFGYGVFDLHLVSVDPSGNTADVRTRARFR